MPGCDRSTSLRASGSFEVLPGFLNRKTFEMMACVSLRASKGRRWMFATSNGRRPSPKMALTSW